MNFRPTMLIFDSLDKRGDVKYSAVDLVKSFINQKYKAEHSGKFRNFKILRLKVGIFCFLRSNLC